MSSMSNIEKLIDILYDLTYEQQSNIMILHEEQNYTKVTMNMNSKTHIQSYARAMVDINPKAAEKMMVCIAEALEDKEMEK